jgi:hypothetical protein
MNSDASTRVLHRFAGDLHFGTKRGGGDWWLPRASFDTHAHFLGPTRVGKTRALQHIAEQLIDLDDCCVVVLDPHDGPRPNGGLFHALKTHCYGNDQTHRLITVDLDDIARHELVVGFNPLTRGRSLAVRAALAAENLRSVAGATETSPVQLVKWSFNTFLGLHAAELSFRDAEAVLDAPDPAYREVFAQILREKYPRVAGDWQRLVEDDARARTRGTAQSPFDFEVGSTKRRLDDYLSNEFIRLMLSTQRFAFDPSSAIAEKKIVLCNLSPRDLMDPHHRKMLGTQLVHAFCRAAMDRADHVTVPCYLIVDEFQEFLCPEVLEILTGGAKFGIHLILAHQFLSQLQDATKQDWRYLSAVLANPGLRVVFGGVEWEDAEKLAVEMFNQDIDLEKIKHELYGTLQTSHTEWLDLRTEMRAQASGTQSSTGSSRSTRHARQGSTTVPLVPTSPFDGGMATTGESDDFAEAFNAATGGNSAAMTGESVAHVPVNIVDEPTQELRSVTFWTKDEQLFLLARELKNQPKQHAALYRRGERTEYGRIANVDDPLLTISDAWGPDRERLEAAAQLPSPTVAPSQLIEDEARERDRALRQRLALPAQDPLDASAAIARRRASRKKT